MRNIVYMYVYCTQRSVSDIIQYYTSINASGTVCRRVRVNLPLGVI